MDNIINVNKIKNAVNKAFNAVYNPDEAPYKMEDNVSAIRIELPNGNVKRRGL